ncbi:MAG: glycerophosphodiester phosphodiesterase family protein [Niabella sp.]
MRTFTLITLFGCLMIVSCKSAQTARSNVPPNKVIAHRGAWKHTGLPQNSIAALKAAIKMGCGGSEFDIHMTADSVLVISHDNDFLGMRIEKSTYTQLLQKTLPNGEKIPTLESFLKTGMSQHYTKLIAEIKPSQLGKERSLALAQKVVEMVHRFKAQGWVTYISFDYDVLKKVRELDATAPLQYLNGDAPVEKLKQDGIGADYHYSVFQKDGNWLSRAHEAGVVTNAWTVDSPEIMDDLLSQKIMFITTDEPEMLLRKLGKK